MSGFSTNIHCDDCKCRGQFSGILTKTSLTQKARAVGWSIGKSTLCPGCVAEAKHQKEKYK
jgi:hypothetical protein